MGRGGGEERAEDRGGGACCARGTGNKDRVVLMWRFLPDVSSHRSPQLEPVPVRPAAAAAGDDGWIEVGGDEHHCRMFEALLYTPAVPGISSHLSLSFFFPSSIPFLEYVAHVELWGRRCRGEEEQSRGGKTTALAAWQTTTPPGSKPLFSPRCSKRVALLHVSGGIVLGFLHRALVLDGRLPVCSAGLRSGACIGELDGDLVLAASSVILASLSVILAASESLKLPVKVHIEMMTLDQPVCNDLSGCTNTPCA
ncbi:hypothetical protein EJB05_43944, partial [Eragrostis curvula]